MQNGDLDRGVNSVGRLIAFCSGSTFSKSNLIVDLWEMNLSFSLAQNIDVLKQSFNGMNDIYHVFTMISYFLKSRTQKDGCYNIKAFKCLCLFVCVYVSL